VEGGLAPLGRSAVDCLTKSMGTVMLSCSSLEVAGPSRPTHSWMRPCATFVKPRSTISRKWAGNSTYLLEPAPFEASKNLK